MEPPAEQKHHLHFKGRGPTKREDPELRAIPSSVQREQSLEENQSWKEASLVRAILIHPDLFASYTKTPFQDLFSKHLQSLLICLLHLLAPIHILSERNCMRQVTSGLRLWI